MDLYNDDTNFCSKVSSWSAIVPVSTIRASYREGRPVLDYPARQWERTLCWPSNAALIGVVNWVTISFLCEKLFSSNSRKKPAIQYQAYIVCICCTPPQGISHWTSIILGFCWVFKVRSWFQRRILWGRYRRNACNVSLIRNSADLQQNVSIMCNDLTP